MQNPVPASVPQSIQNSPIVQKFSDSNKKNLYITVFAILIILAGIASGFFLSNLKKRPSSKLAAPSAIQTKNEVGITDEKTFKDSAEGVLKEGGIEGEGMFHLERPGGDSQNVYLTSTAVDLGSFIDKKVQVWGQTIAARKAGWLMDVGKIKML
ncbi:MAG: hypothetical protein HY044_02455 [Candidatus Woesebacteria bacterium]|nr:MAG: hypothetical protein HY044_02455 [Candidatus Woesebacteria bacterium]